LQNGKSIVQVARPRVEYRHVELDSHDILLAQGLPAESFLDTGNRAAFANGADFIAAHPDVEPKPWTQTRAPLVFEGPPVWRAKAALLERLRAQGCDTTSDADLHVIANGKRIDAVQLEARRVYVVIPAGVSDAVLKSRTFIPAHAVADSDDTRKLGICVKRFQIDGEDVAIDSPDLSDADWHAPEPAHRWTRGAVALPANIRVVLIDLAEDALYWREPRDNVVALFG
jgi:hypothetical protein